MIIMSISEQFTTKSMKKYMKDNHVKQYRLPASRRFRPTGFKQLSRLLVARFFVSLCCPHDYGTGLGFTTRQDRPDM